MELLAAIGISAIFLGLYVWGWHDGRDEERELSQWKRMDELIAAVAVKKAAEN